MVMNKCKDCKWWQIHNGYNCTENNEINSCGLITNDLTSETAYFYGHEAYRQTLITNENFGCVLWEDKKELG